MVINTADRDTLTLSFMIPNVSRLLIFRDHWNNSMVMRRVITELLKTRNYHKLYLGSDPEAFANETIITENAAIINIKILGITLLEYKIEDFTDYFIAELQNRKNVLHYENNIINPEKQISGINISIKVTETVKVKSEIQAA